MPWGLASGKIETTVLATVPGTVSSCPSLVDSMAGPSSSRTIPRVEQASDAAPVQCTWLYQAWSKGMPAASAKASICSTMSGNSRRMKARFLRKYGFSKSWGRASQNSR